MGEGEGEGWAMCGRHGPVQVTLKTFGGVYAVAGHILGTRDGGTSKVHRVPLLRGWTA